jgi:hypothetical protein
MSLYRHVKHFDHSIPLRSSAKYLEIGSPIAYKFTVHPV